MLKMQPSQFLIIDERHFRNLLLQVRKAQGKLHQVKGGREIIDELNWIIRAIELTSYEDAETQMRKLMIEQYLHQLNNPAID